LIKATVGLIGDYADCCGAQIRQSLGRRFVEDVVTQLKNQPDLESQQTADWTVNKVQEAFKDK